MNVWVIFFLSYLYWGVKRDIKFWELWISPFQPMRGPGDYVIRIPVRVVIWVWNRADARNKRKKDDPVSILGQGYAPYFFTTAHKKGTQTKTNVTSSALLPNGTYISILVSIKRQFFIVFIYMELSWKKLHSFRQWQPKTGTRQIWRVIFIGVTFYARRYDTQV